MARDIVDTVKVTFASSLPMGTRGTFTHSGELWIAYPAEKNRYINSSLDRLIGHHARMRNEMTRWINVRPQDAELVVRALNLINETQQVIDALTIEKAKAVTM